MDEYGVPQGQGGKPMAGGQYEQGGLPPPQRPSRGPTYAGQGGAPTQRGGGGGRMSNEQKEQKLRMGTLF